MLQWRQTSFNGVLLIVFLGTSLHFLRNYDKSSGIFLPYGLKVPQRLLRDLKHWWDSVKTIDIEAEDQRSPAFSYGSLKEFSTTEEGHFATSSEIRWIHPNTVLYRVGEVVKVKHKISGKSVSGVIVGWDEQCKAPQNILESKPEDYPIDQPHYLVLMDSIEANVVYEPYQYAAQNEVELSRNPKKITSVTSGDYFERYQNGKYHPRPWLKQIYPRD